MLYNVYYMTVEIYQPSRWQLILPALLQWTSFVACHNIGALAFQHSHTLDVPEDCLPLNTG